MKVISGFTLTIFLVLFCQITLAQPKVYGNRVKGPALETFPGEAGPFKVKVVKAHVGKPWSIRLAPNTQDLYYTDRDEGKIYKLNLETPELETVLEIPQVRVTFQAGMLGMALDKNFSENNVLYACYSTWRKAVLNIPENRVSRIELLGSQQYRETILLDHIAGSSDFHNGCRVVVGEGDKLFISMGDTANPELSQNIHVLSGKVLRINLDGSIPADNPWPDSPVWSFGHRNPTGLAINPVTGSVWSTEHSTQKKDELNLIQKGGNYGWPLCIGVDKCDAVPNHVPARAEFETEQSVAISNLMFYSGKKKKEWANDLFFVTLKTGRIYRVDMDGDKIRQIEILVDGGFGRFRDIVESPEGDFIVSTEGYVPEDAPQGDSHILRFGL